MAEVTNSDSIIIGSLFSKAGVTSLIEKSLGNAVSLAVDEINAAGGISGRELKLLQADPKCDLKLFQTECRRLLDQGASTIFGCYKSSSRKVVLPIVESQQKLLFYPTFYEGFEFSPNCIYGGAVPNQNTIWLADYMFKNYKNKFLLVGSNYVFPYESNRVMRDIVANRRGSVVDEIYIPLDPDKKDIDRVIKKIKKHGPLNVFSTIVGDGLVAFYKAFKEAGIDPEENPICSLITGEVEVSQIGSEAAKGHVTAAPYFSNIDSEENLKFITSYQSKFGLESPISAATEAAYTQVHLFAQAVKRAGTDDKDSILRVLPTFSFEAPQGSVRVSQENHHTILWPRVGVVNEDGKFDIVVKASSPVRPDPYLIEYVNPVESYPRFMTSEIGG